MKRPAKQKPFFRFYHAESLRTKTVKVLDAVDAAEDSRKHREALANIIIELTNEGFDYFYLKPLKLAKVNFFVEQSAQLGISGTTRVMASVIRGMIGGMDHDQLRTVCAYIRQLME
jgi:hypothetical protein